MARLRSGLGPYPGPGSTFGGSFLLSILILGLFSSSAHGTCYVPNGSDRNAGLSQEVYQPCDAGDQHSMCCASNRLNADRCRNDGLCLSAYDGIIWRESCTDPTWKSPSCIKLCDSGIGHFIEGFDVDLATTDQSVTPCDNGSYCCGNGTLADSCCKDGKGLFVVDGKVVSASETASSASTATNLAPSSQGDSSHTTGTSTDIAASQKTSTSTLSASTSSAAKSSNKTGVIVGGVIGGFAVLALLIGTAAWIWMHRNRRNQHGHTALPTNWSDQSVGRKQEVPGHTRIHEMDALVPAAELEHPTNPHGR